MEATTKQISPTLLTLRTRNDIDSLLTAVGSWAALSDKVISRVNTLLVRMLACEFAQNKFLDQTADDMYSHVNPKISEYMAGSAIRTRVVSGGDGISN